MFFHELVYFVVFLVRPSTFVFALVQVIEPAFSAMFRGFEYDLPWTKKHMLRYIVPATFTIVDHRLSQKLILLRSPINSMFVF